MNIEKTEILLRKFDYTFKKTEHQLEIKLGLGLRVIADFSKSEKIIIKDSVTTWNFLTGILNMSLKSGIMYNFIGTFIFTGLFFFGFDTDDYVTPALLLLILIFIVLLWSNYYLIKAEQMKHTLIRWNEN